MTAAVTAPEGCTHPVIGRRVLIPGSTFVARNRVSGRCSTFVYTGHLAETASGELIATATDRRGNARSVPVSAIVTVRPMRKRAAS